MTAPAQPAAAAETATPALAADWMPPLVRIPAGTVFHGDARGDGDSDERPGRWRDIAAFAMGRTQVTAAQYLAFLADTGMAGESRPDLHAFPEQSSSGLRVGADGRIECPRGAERYPVVYVSWHGACAYCEWLSRKLGARVRLPAEAEWEYAADGPGRTRWALGNDFRQSEYVSNRAGPLPVGQHRASPFGLCDMTGNVFEWSLDSYHVPPGAPEPEVELPGSRLIKGGAFILRGPRNFRNAKRFSADQASCLDCVGFRVLCEDPATGGVW